MHISIVILKRDNKTSPFYLRNNWDDFSAISLSRFRSSHCQQDLPSPSHAEVSKRHHLRLSDHGPSPRASGSFLRFALNGSALHFRHFPRTPGVWTSGPTMESWGRVKPQQLAWSSSCTCFLSFEENGSKFEGPLKNPIKTKDSPLPQKNKGCIPLLKIWSIWAVWAVWAP